MSTEALYCRRMTLALPNHHEDSMKKSRSFFVGFSGIPGAVKTDSPFSCWTVSFKGLLGRMVTNSSTA